MIKKLNALFMIFCLGLLVSCAAQKAALQHRTDYKTCKASCLARFKQCQPQCKRDCVHCQGVNRCETGKNYKQYVREQCVAGGFVARQLNSYRDPLKCRQTTCNCKADLHVCLQACQGEIKKSLSIPSPCC